MFGSVVRPRGSWFKGRKAWRSFSADWTSSEWREKGDAFYVLKGCWAPAWLRNRFGLQSAQRSTACAGKRRSCLRSFWELVTSSRDSDQANWVSSLMAEMFCAGSWKKKSSQNGGRQLVCSFIGFSQDLSVSQQCFSLTINQHQSDLSAQKPTSEQVKCLLSQ